MTVEIDRVNPKLVELALACVHALTNPDLRQAERVEIRRTLSWINRPMFLVTEAGGLDVDEDLQEKLGLEPPEEDPDDR